VASSRRRSQSRFERPPTVGESPRRPAAPLVHERAQFYPPSRPQPQLCRLARREFPVVLDTNSPPRNTGGSALCILPNRFLSFAPAFYPRSSFVSARSTHDSANKRCVTFPTRTSGPRAELPDTRHRDTILADSPRSSNVPRRRLSSPFALARSRRPQMAPPAAPLPIDDSPTIDI
jgi:hypothetical protein